MNSNAAAVAEPAAAFQAGRVSTTMRFNFEETDRVRAAFVGCGDHAYRNVYPCLRYAPVDLVAVCDWRIERARHFARQFGAGAAYQEFAQMLEAERPDAVFLVTGYDADSRPTYPALAIQAMRAGCHVWMEKPPAASVAEVDAMIVASRETGRFAMVGFKKCYFPANDKAKQIISSPEFGRVDTVFARYPQAVPHPEARRDGRAVLGLLDHLCHPASLLYYLMGPFASVRYRRCAANGAAVISIRFASGAVGALHLAAGQSGASPLERLELVGDGANLMVENGARLTFYRRGGRGPGGYGRAASFIGEDAGAPLAWEPEFTLGQLYNQSWFLLGYAQEIAAFVEAVRNGTPPDRCCLDMAREVTRLYESILAQDA